ncbi:MAG: hypothetical protein K0Q79_640 [Flavipsychrobacter sp.]|jgi:hypothetical protein|nr:hypothetical protein [Flavipsychrobacter sp.]
MSLRHCTYYLLLLLLLTGCSGDTTDNLAKWRITLNHEDKIPYGTYLAYESLKYYFKGAKVEVLSQGFKYTNMDSKMKYPAGRSLMVLEGLRFYVSEKEWDDLKQFIRDGNEVIIFSSWIDKKIQEELKVYKWRAGDETNMLYIDKEDFDHKNILKLTNAPGKTYGYEGRSIRGYFEFTYKKDTTEEDKKSSNENSTAESDTVTEDSAEESDYTEEDNSYEIAITPDTLGKAGEQPNFIRYSIGDGHLTLHAAPLTLTNYFLLQDGNENYLTGIWQTLPSNITQVYWQDFYARNTESSSLAILWQYPATRLALILALIAILVYIFFEGKRKQRVIPIIPPVRNESVSFVETVGRLYYNKRNHANLADKMVQQFLEWVRSHYFLNTNMLNDTFINQLTIKSGQNEIVVKWLVSTIHEIKLGGANIDDDYLYKLYTVLQKFYKKEIVQISKLSEVKT